MLKYICIVTPTIGKWAVNKMILGLSASLLAFPMLGFNGVIECLVWHSAGRMKPLDCIVACVKGHYPSMHSSLTSAVCVWFVCVGWRVWVSSNKPKLSPLHWFIFVFCFLLSPFLLSPYRLFRLLCVKYWQGQEARGRWRANASVILLLSPRNVSRWGPRSAKLLILVILFLFRAKAHPSIKARSIWAAEWHANWAEEIW